VLFAFSCVFLVVVCLFGFCMFVVSYCVGLVGVLVEFGWFLVSCLVSLRGLVLFW